MKLIIGLGNPGEQYHNTRHNVGYLVLDKLVQKLQNSKTPNSKQILNFKMNEKLDSLVMNYESSVIFAKPLTFMNNSGKAVKKLTSYYHINTPDIWVIHDDLDIKLSQYKIQFGVGPKVHNGINSIEKYLNTKDFWRVRVGIENRGQGLRDGRKISGEEYVLKNFKSDEMEVRDKVIDQLMNDLIKLISK